MAASPQFPKPLVGAGHYRLGKLLIFGMLGLGVVLVLLLSLVRDQLRLQQEKQREADESRDAFKAFIRKRIAPDAERLIQLSGYCTSQRHCETYIVGRDFERQIRDGEGELSIMLYENAYHRAPEDYSFTLELTTRAPAPHGDLGAVAPRLGRVAESILDRFNFDGDVQYNCPKEIKRPNATYRCTDQGDLGGKRLYDGTIGRGART